MIRDDFGRPSRLLGSPWSCCVPGRARLCAPLALRLPVANRPIYILRVREGRKCKYVCDDFASNSMISYSTRKSILSTRLQANPHINVNNSHKIK